MVVSVFWSATFEDSENNGGIASNVETLMPPWVDSESNGEDAVDYICEHYFDHEIWDQEFGIDDEAVTIRFELHKPPSIAGTYSVDLDRVTKARARKLGERR